MTDKEKHNNYGSDPDEVLKLVGGHIIGSLNPLLLETDFYTVDAYYRLYFKSNKIKLYGQKNTTMVQVTIYNNGLIEYLDTKTLIILYVKMK